MSWGSKNKDGSSIPNGDNSYGYIVRMTRTLTMDDNGAEIRCYVTPKIGDAVMKSWTLNVVCKYFFLNMYVQRQMLHISIDWQDPHDFMAHLVKKFLGLSE